MYMAPLQNEMKNVDNKNYSCAALLLILLVELLLQIGRVV